MTTGGFFAFFCHVEGFEYVKDKHPDILRQWTEFMSHNPRGGWVPSSVLWAWNERCLRFWLDEGMPVQGEDDTKSRQTYSLVQRLGQSLQLGLLNLQTRLPRPPGTLVSFFYYVFGSDPLHSCMFSGNMGET